MLFLQIGKTDLSPMSVELLAQPLQTRQTKQPNWQALFPLDWQNAYQMSQ